MSNIGDITYSKKLGGFTMDHKEEFEKISRQSIDMLITATMKRHGITIDKKPEMSEQEKDELRKLIEDLKSSVATLTNIQKK